MDCQALAQAARDIYGHIQDDFKVTLLAAVITERELLKHEMSAEELSEGRLNDIISRWQGGCVLLLFTLF